VHIQPESEILLQTSCIWWDARISIQLTRAFEVDRFGGDFDPMRDFGAA
jgi:hypothetical protein